MGRKFIVFAISCVCLIAAPSGRAPAGETAIPRAEHPLPQMERAEWLNLNGVWEFAETDDSRDESFLAAPALPDRITVPFARESRLSGLARRGFVKNVWYRRTFAVPAGWRSPRVRLQVGASDYRTRAWVNGKPVGTHTGGSASFAFDITGSLHAGDNVLVIHAFDDTRSGLQPCGKQAQSEESEGCVYTRTTGIWQTVWIEGVGGSFVRDLAIVPDPDNSRVHLQVEVDGPSAGLTVSARALLGEREVGTIRTPAAWRDARLVLDLAEKKLWSLTSPDLYSLEITLSRGEEVVDRVRSYFGLRAVTIEGMAMLLNRQPVFQRLVLDQGFYPEGIWTAPSDADLRRDIELSKAAGFNGARLHQKVFEPRLLYWADRLGYLLWGEFPNWGLDYKKPEIDLPVIEEWEEVLRRDRNHPAIVGWCPFNETPPDAGPLQAAVAAVTRAIDPTRPVLESSGYAHSIPHPQVLDAHDYDQSPPSFKARWESRLSSALDLPERYGGAAVAEVPFFVSEYGGIGWFDRKGEAAWGYGNSPRTLEEFYQRFAGLADAQLDNRFLCGFCYTQLTDVEQERNGIYYYDRTPKFDVERLKKINSRPARYETDPPLPRKRAGRSWRVLAGAFPDGERSGEWRFSTEAPAGAWAEPGFDDASWKVGRGGFGQKGGWENRIRTPWSGKDIWLRQPVAADGAAFEAAELIIHYDNATEVLLNGLEIWRGQGWNDDYAAFDISEALKKSLRPGKNLLAVHCHQDEGGQFIDLAILLGVGG
jgi:glycosyl hydrolase family 2